MNIVEELLDDIETYIDTCKVQPFSNNRKIVIERDVIDEYLSEIRMRIPEELERCAKIVNNKEAIISDARKQAEKLLSNASYQTNQLINEHEITQQAAEQANLMLENAQIRAQEIINQSVEEANAIQESAIRYTDDILAGLQEMIADNASNIQTQFSGFMNSIQNSYETVTSNRQELAKDLSESTPVKEDIHQEETTTQEDIDSEEEV